MRTLALDLGSTFGWAMYDDADGSVTHGSVTLTGTQQERFATFQGWLEGSWRGPSSTAGWLEGQALGTGRRRNTVVFEEVQSRWQSIAAAQVYCGFRGVLMAWAHGRVKLVGVPPGTIKRFATGKGNADKFDMVLAAESLTSKPMRDHNEADAVCLLHYYRSTL